MKSHTQLIRLKTIVYLITFWLNIFFLKASPDEKRLQEDLIRGYNRNVRPVAKNTDQLVVKFGIRLIQILDVDEKNQVLTTNVWLKHVWQDFNLKWDPMKYNNLTSVSVPSNDIWVPDIILFNSADGKYEITSMTRAKINYKGVVEWEPPAIYKSSCTIDVEFFPFDQQQCTMTFGSWTYDGLQVDLIHIDQVQEENGTLSSNFIQIGIDLLDFQQSHEWYLQNVPAKRVVIPPIENTDEHYIYILFNLELQRKTLFYTFNLIIPCVCLSFLTVLTFYLPSESGEKISLCISILLSLTFFVLLLYDLIPPTSLVVPLIGKYILFTVILVTLSIFSTVIILNLHFRSPVTHIMPIWAKKLFLIVLPKLLLLKTPEFDYNQVNKITNNYGSCFLKESLMGKFLENNENDLELQILMIAKSLEMKATCKSSKNKSKFKEQKIWFNNTQITFRSWAEFQYFMDKRRAITTLNKMVENLKKEDEELKVKQEWKFTALVIDRLFLFVFTTSCIVGTVAIIMQAPSFYVRQKPIDEIMSTKFKKS